MVVPLRTARALGFVAAVALLAAACASDVSTGPQAAAGNTRFTTEAAIDAAIARGDAIEVDLGFAFNCSVVPATVYQKGTPVG